MDAFPTTSNSFSTTPCICSVFPCESYHLFPCLLAFWPLSNAAFLLPSLCLLSTTPDLTTLPTREAHGLSDCLEQPGIPSLTGLQCCIHRLLFSKTTFLGCAYPKMTKHELAAPALTLQLADEWVLSRTCSSAPLFNYCILLWAYFIKQCL